MKNVVLQIMCHSHELRRVKSALAQIDCKFDWRKLKRIECYTNEPILGLKSLYELPISYKRSVEGDIESLDFDLSICTP